MQPTNSRYCTFSQTDLDPGAMVGNKMEEFCVVPGLKFGRIQVKSPDTSVGLMVILKISRPMMSGWRAGTLTEGSRVSRRDRAGACLISFDGSKLFTFDGPKPSAFPITYLVLSMTKIAKYDEDHHVSSERSTFGWCVKTPEMSKRITRFFTKISEETDRLSITIFDHDVIDPSIKVGARYGLRQKT